MEKKQETKKSLKQLGSKVVEQIEHGENPALEVPIRTLSNVKYDPNSKMITMGAGLAKRYFFNVGHVRKFVQTIEAAAVAKPRLEESRRGGYPGLQQPPRCCTGDRRQLAAAAGACDHRTADRQRGHLR